MTDEEKARELSLYKSGDIDIIRYDAALSMAEWKNEQFGKAIDLLIKTFEKYARKSAFSRDDIIKLFKAIKNAMEE